MTKEDAIFELISRIIDVENRITHIEEWIKENHNVEIHEWWRKKKFG